MCYEAENILLYKYCEVHLALTVAYVTKYPTVALKMHVQITALILSVVVSNEHDE